jgi:hypothetical protein
MNERDLLIENIIDNNKKKKDKVDGKAKGNRTELHLCKLLTKHFGVEFTRSVGSGNRWGQVKLSEQAKQVYSGDICVPEGFKWVIECKGGYDSVDLDTTLEGDNARLDSFIEQSSHDADYCGRKPIVCWKRNRMPWVAMLRGEDLNGNMPYLLHYRDWVIVSLEKLLLIKEKGFWFNDYTGKS